MFETISSSSVLATSRGLSWERLNAVGRIDRPGYLEPEDVDGIEIHIHLGPEVGVRWSEGGPYRRSLAPPGRTAILRERRYSKRIWEGESHYLRIALAREHVEADDALASVVAPGHWLVANDPFHDFGMLLLSEMRTPAFHGDLIAETIVGSILACGETPSAASHTMSSRQLGVVIEHLMDARDQPVRVGDLAKNAGMSHYAFSRAFKTSTGYSPYQFALQLKVARAKMLLTDGLHTGTAVAAAVGFHDESHFSRTFKRIAGITPKEWSAQRPR